MDLSKLISENLQFYDNIKPKSSPNNYTVLATINDHSNGNLLALATGTQANLRIYPDDIEDCHAESLVKRAYKRYLLNTISEIVSRKANLTNIDKSIKQTCSQDLILFISQFPCGHIKRYEGEEPLDEQGLPIQRKPGRGTVKDGKVVYVPKSSCLVKLEKWVKTGLQGKKLNELFQIQSNIKTIVIGDCEPSDEFNYESCIERLRQYFPGDHMPHIELVKQIRRDEFVFAADKQPQPVALVWWRTLPNLESATNQSKRRKSELTGYHEMVVDGRKRGLTKKQYFRGILSTKLQISNHILRRDLENIGQLCCREQISGD